MSVGLRSVVDLVVRPFRRRRRWQRWDMSWLDRGVTGFGGGELWEVLRMKWTQVVSWAMPLVNLIWGQVSPGLKDAIREAVAAWDAKAKETPNKADDFVVGLVKWLLSVMDAD